YEPVSNTLSLELKVGDIIDKQSFLNPPGIHVVLRISQWWRKHINYLLNPLLLKNHIAGYERAMTGFEIKHFGYESEQFGTLQIHMTGYNLAVFFSALEG